MSTDTNTRAFSLSIYHILNAALTTACKVEQDDDGGEYVTQTDPVALSRYLAADFRRELDKAERAIADALPALTPADFLKACNGDHAIEGEVTRWRDARWSMVNVSELADATDRYGEPATEETWTILRGSSRFEVREVPRYAAYQDGPDSDWYVHDNHDNDRAGDFDAQEACGITGDPTEYTEEQARAVAAWLTANAPGSEDTNVYIVWDTDLSQDAREGRNGIDDYDATDEDSATEAAAAANVEDYRTNAAGWPFAQNYAAAIDEHDADDFAACGFIVARHEPSGQVYAGIDGGGYDFLQAHWAPLYLRFMLGGPYPRPCIYVPTRDGLRRVVK